MPEEVQQPTPQSQVTVGTKSHDWKKVSLTVLIILVVSGLLVAAYWFLVLNKSSDNSDLTGPVPKITTPKATESAKEATPSAKNGDVDNWKTFSGTASDIVIGGDEVSINVSFKHPNEYEEGRLEEYTIISTKPFRLSGPVEPGELQVVLALHTTEASKKLIANSYNGETTNSTLGGKTAKRLTHSSTNQGTAYNIINYVVDDVGKNSWALEFRCLYFPKAGSELEKTCDLMASTFKFLD